MNLSTCHPNFWTENETMCLDYLNKEWDKIPLVNVNDIQNLCNNTLVRFRGMVQDMYNPEYFFERYEVVNEITQEKYMKNGKYLDIADCTENEKLDFNSVNNKSSERQTLVVISTPGVNSWVETIEIEQNRIDTPSATSASPTKNKRKLDDDEEMEVENTQQVESPSTSAEDDKNKKICTEEGKVTKDQPLVSHEHLLNFPLAGRTGKACHMKIYEKSDSLKLNDVCEFVGFLSVDPMLTVCDRKDNDMDDEMEFQTHNPSPALIPRIHCVSFKKILHSNPLVAELNMTNEKIEDARKELLIVLTQLLLGDELAAEYLMYHLISRVYLRRELRALGKFCVNILNIPALRIPDYVEKVYEFIDILMPKSHYLPLTLENMNSLSFVPKKDYDCNRLTSGVLQLSNNTHLVLDETKMTAGKLYEAGIMGVKALSELIKDQVVSYDFKYYQMRYDCDIPILIFSEGKSILPSDFSVPLKSAELCINEFENLVASTKAYLIPERLNDIRKFLTHARLAEYTMSENVPELVQNEFVEMRQRDKVSPEDLHQLLVLARLVCLSEGRPVLNDECWKKACTLESQRKERLSKYNERK